MFRVPVEKAVALLKPRPTSNGNSISLRDDTAADKIMNGFKLVGYVKVNKHYVEPEMHRLAHQPLARI